MRHCKQCDGPVNLTWGSCHTCGRDPKVWQVPSALLWTCENCQNRNVPRNRHCGSREALNGKKNKRGCGLPRPAEEQWKFVGDPTPEPSWSVVALYEEDLHRNRCKIYHDTTAKHEHDVGSEHDAVEEESEQEGQEKVEEKNINVYLESEHPEICLRRGQRDGDANANQKIFLQETMFSQREYRKTIQRKFRALPSLQPLNNILHTHSYCKSNSLQGLGENLVAGYTSAA